MPSCKNDNHNIIVATMSIIWRIAHFQGHSNQRLEITHNITSLTDDANPSEKRALPCSLLEFIIIFLFASIISDLLRGFGLKMEDMISDGESES